MKKALLTFLLFWYSIIPTASAIDILENIYTPSKQNNQVVDMGNNKTAVWNAIFRQSINVVWGGVQESLLVRVTKTILRSTLIVWVSMWIIIGIRYILSQWDEWQQKKLQWYLWNIIYGILIAFSALVIVELVLSITRNSITF